MKKEKNIIGNNIKKVKQKMPMVFYLSVFIFAISCVTAIIAFFLYVIFVNAGFMTEITLIWLVLVLLFGSVVISTSLVRGLGNKIIFGSLRQITRASKAVANGDFSQRLEPPREKEIAELCDSFNEMVNKLGTNELLARDFISNVSHQFRTPISSIHGYAQLLEDDSISTEEKLEYIEVIKDLHMRQPFSSTAEIVSGNIADDFSYYFAKSEQIPSAVGLGVAFNEEDKVKSAGGFLIQVMPGCKDEYIQILEERLSQMKPCTKMIEEGYSAEDIINEITGGDYQLLETKELKYECNCSKERFTKGLKSLGKVELTNILNEDHQAEITCNFCNKKYLFTEDDLKNMIYELD
jgi:redox-regulated HSP33 family molecular chaperone/HAMP domain-containing protein